MLHSKFAVETYFVGGMLFCSSPQLMHTYPEVSKRYKGQRPVTDYTQLTQRQSPAGMSKLSLLFILQFQTILTLKHGGRDSLQPLWTIAVQPG